MDIEKQREILRILRVFNPWWETGRIENVESFKRLDFFAIQRRLNDPEIITLVGARQVGKTTMMEQLVEHLLTKESPKQVLFIRADNAGLNAVSKSPIEDSLQVYQEYVLKEEMGRITRRIFVLIDEVQKIENWTESVKGWYDINKKIKFVISGSSSAKILMDSTKPFVGRAARQVLAPFKFVETARYKKSADGQDHQHINPVKNALRNRLIEALEKKSVSEA
ncbi:MAG TPA: AAA family ATPase, partial [archaeon]|nr:AAA family ATPase [archaeon]